MEFFRADRPFKTWGYSVSHARLLLRSVDGGTAPRIDVLFIYVLAHKLSYSTRSLCLRDPHDHEWPVLKVEIEAVDSNIIVPTIGTGEARLLLVDAGHGEARLFVIDAGHGIGWVVAQSMSVTEDPDRWANPGLFDAKPSATEVVFVTPSVVRRQGDASA